MESGIYLLLLILLQGMAKTEAFADEEDNPFFLSAYFTAKGNKRLKGYAVKRFESPSLLSCSHACMRTEWCSSTNFKLSSKNDIKGTCELNKYALIDENAVFDEEEGNTFSLILKVI